MNKYNPRGLLRFHVQQMSQLHQSHPLADRIAAQPTWIPTPSRSKQMNVIVVRSRECGCVLTSQLQNTPNVASLRGEHDFLWLLSAGKGADGCSPNPSLFRSSLHGCWQLSSSFGGYGENESTQILKNQLHSQKGFKKLGL